jgi:hypothetical protein
MKSLHSGRSRNVTLSGTQVAPFQLSVHDTPADVGFELTLYATHDRGHTSLTPGCDRCVETFAGLQRIAECILPREHRPSMYDILPFDSSLHLSARHHLLPEVTLTIHIVHRRGYQDPIDECEKRCLQEMEDNLHQLGIPRNASAGLSYGIG